jgi:phage terminase large subunit-like protein
MEVTPEQRHHLLGITGGSLRPVLDALATAQWSPLLIVDMKSRGAAERLGLTSTQELVERWRFLPRFFVPADAIANRVRRDRVPYDKWAREGALIATEGNVVDYDFIKAQILADAEMFQIERFGFDPFNATQVMIQLGQEGLLTEKVRQGFLSLSAPSKELERLLLSEMFEHGGHPILEWCASNVAIETDAAGNIKPSKAKSTEKIDGIAALVSALALAGSEEMATAAPEIIFL